jgi:zinc D-Ala-D-Ala carboxypeptidase
MPAEMLSTNFALAEITESQTASRRGIDNVPDAVTQRNLKRLADTLEVVRTLLGNVPIRISSGYRSPALNKAVGGSKNSAHMKGLAVDFTAPRFGTVLQTAKAIASSDIEFDQIIYEYGAWVHLGLAVDAMSARRQLLSIAKGTGYVDGLTQVN